MKTINIIYKTLVLVLAMGLIACDEDLKQDMEVIGKPAITDFAPKSGKAGTEITITGEHLQKIDVVTIGGSPAEVKYRISPTEMVVLVTSGSKSGKISLSGINGDAETSDSFTMEYAVPGLSKYPSTAKSNDEIFIEGTNLDAVMDVYFDKTKGEIISKSSKDMVVKVPYFEEFKVDILLSYNTAEGLKQTGTSGKPFELERVAPTVADAPATGESGTTVTVTGTNLTLIDAVWFGEYQGTIQQKSETEMSIIIPSDFDDPAEVVFKMVYYGDKELVVNEKFAITVPDKETIYYWENKTIYANDESTPNNFFNALTGEIYTPCDYEGVKNNIHFYISISASSIQLNNPNNSENQTKNFKCNGVALPTEKMPNVVKFKSLSPSNEADNIYIEKVKNKTLVSVTPQDIEDAGIATTAPSNTRRFYGEGSSNNQMSPGDVLLILWYDGATITKVGFLEIVKFTSQDPTKDKTSSMTFNCYFQK